MTDKKQISVNESLAKVNMILRSAGVIPLPFEHNAALSILADVACQQQEEIDALRERVQSQLSRDASVPTAFTSKELLLALNELGNLTISEETIERARELFSNIENQAKALINENEILRNSAMQSTVTITMPNDTNEFKTAVQEIYSFGDLRLSGNIEVTPNEGFNIYSRNVYKNRAHIGKVCYGYKMVYSEDLIPESELISLISKAVESAPDFK
ncbi:MAG: hypothetical protein ACTID4_12630 [Hafnia alvei]|uniref:hypothetical protein n=1 Tax=Hafnia alvei TaxID=569 RepID=UPI003F91C263